jgi:hypothetical protein
MRRKSKHFLGSGSFAQPSGGFPDQFLPPGGGFAPSSGAAVAPAWSPLDLSPSRWYKYDDVTGDPVDSWNDKSGNAQHATGTTTARPDLVANQVNGHPSLTWEPASLTKLTMPDLAVTANMTIVAVAKMHDAGGTYRPILYSSASAPTVYMNHGPDGVTTNDRPSLYWTSGNVILGGDYLGGVGWKTCRWMWDASTLSFAVNDGAAITESHALTASGNFQTIGCAADFYYFDGKMAELIIIPSVLTAGEIVSLNAYLSDEYGLW